MVDDAGFDLVTMSEDVTAKSTDAITGLVLGGVRTLQVLLTLRADGNLAAGLLNEAASVPDPAALQPLRERFDAAASHAKKLLGQLSAPAAEGPLRSLTETLIASALQPATSSTCEAKSSEKSRLLRLLWREAVPSSYNSAGKRLTWSRLRKATAMKRRFASLGHPQRQGAAAPHHRREPCGGDSDRNAVCDLSSGEANRENYPCDERARGGRHGDRRAGSRSDRRNRPDGRGARRLPRHGDRASEGERKRRFAKAADVWRSRSKASPKRFRSMTARIASSCATANTKRSSILAATSR